MGTSVVDILTDNWDEATVTSGIIDWLANYDPEEKTANGASYGVLVGKVQYEYRTMGTQHQVLHPRGGIIHKIWVRGMTDSSGSGDTHVKALLDHIVEICDGFGNAGGNAEFTELLPRIDYIEHSGGLNNRTLTFPVLGVKNTMTIYT